MKKLIIIVFAICFLAGVVIITTGKLQSQDFQDKERTKQDQTEKPLPPKPKGLLIPEPSMRDTSSALGGQKIFRLKIKIKSEEEQKVVERTSLACEGKTECICNATLSQLEELKSAGIEFVVEKEGIKIEKGSAYGQNESNYWIPEGDWTYSPITITSAPVSATVTSIDVYYEVIHTYIGDLIIDLTDQDLGHEWNLWYYEGGSGDNIQEAEWDITEFNGELVNQTWKLWGYDCCAGDDGYIDYWSIQIWYEDLPDLIVQSLFPSDYYPPITEHVNVTLTIQNQSIYPVNDSFYTDFYKNRASTPPIPSTGEEFCYWKSGLLSAGETKTYTVYKLPTNYSTGSWRMWGVVDSRPNSWGNIQESNENNNKLSEYLYWSDPPSPHYVTRDQIIQHAQECDNVSWYCYPWYTYSVPQCPDWSSDYTAGYWYYGEAYCWGGWDKWEDFSDYLYYGLLRPGSHDENDCGQPDPYWATGTDCSGLVSRCWELGQKHNCSMLASASISTQISANSLLPGDILNKTSAPAHVRLFSQWVDADRETLLVYESRSRGIGNPAPVDTKSYYLEDLLTTGYVPRRFNYVQEAPNNPPVIDGHIQCKYPQDECEDCIQYGQDVTIEILAHDPDGDSMFYEWWCSFGHFTNGQHTMTTPQNYVTYVAPTKGKEGEETLFDDVITVAVTDVRGGQSWAEGNPELHDPGYTCLCGDVNDDGIVELGDYTFLGAYLFRGGAEPVAPIERADVNNDCVIDVGDYVYLGNYLYRNIPVGAAPPPECCWFPPE